MTHPILPQQNAEPWIPEGLLEKLVVGARVRVRFNGECDLPPGETSFSAGLGLVLDHDAHGDANHKIGRIDHIYAEPPAHLRPAHCYLIYMDEPYEFGGQSWHFLSAAASELVPLSDEERER